MDFPTMQVNLAVGSHRLALRVLESFDTAVNTLCDALPTDVSDDRLLAECPFFAKVWPSAQAMAAVVERLGAAWLSGRQVLELGCGLALPSLIAARLGAEVLATDYNPGVPGFLTHNLALNGLAGRVRYENADWQEGGLELGRFDLILASDVLYTPRHAGQLAALIGRHLAPGGRAVVADPGRAYLQEFWGRLPALGLSCELEALHNIYLLHIQSLA